MSKVLHLFRIPSQSPFASVTLLLLRVVVGLAFVFHGWGKIQHPFSWMPPEAPVAIPGMLQFLAALSEFGGGLAWILGFLSPLASLGIAFTMAVAVFTHLVVKGDPFVSMTGGHSYELALVYFSIAVLFLAMGPGRISVDRFLFGKRILKVSL